MKYLSISLGRLKVRIPLSDLEKMAASARKPAKPAPAPAPAPAAPEVLAPGYTPRHSAVRADMTAIIRELEVGQEKVLTHPNPRKALAEATAAVTGMKYHAPDLRVHFRREREGIRMVRVS